ncbi:cytochrome-c peroxidase [Methylomonas lenta]|uniref:Cytochrome-c peroxidase n=1 Tax=Methylomonas lenta TaxID=980561 RepID=A0A177NDK8_9GAMM|nr:cytochrome c peroxidase [Methylomonas lenta]OAI15931.1 cytochrome-c peroxidase [Methylomonas lenta]
MRLLTFLLGLTVSSTLWADSLLGLPALIIPADNPQTADKIALGQRLFNDKRLSGDGSISCASCHQEAKAFSDGLPLAKGIDGQIGTRNTPTVLNAAFYSSQFLDGRAASLEEQALGPFLNPIEHGLKSQQTIVDSLRQDADYLKAFTRVFDIQADELTIAHVGKAIASYQRTLIAGDSAFDRYLFGMQPNAISESAVRGSRIFKRKGNCVTCHEISMKHALFTDNRFYNIGIGSQRLAPVLAELQAASERREQPDLSGWTAAQRSELGRYLVTQQAADIGRFKTPTLRNIALTGPYMHDGSLQTLEAVVEHYDKGGAGSDGVDAKIFPLHLTAAEKKDLVAFLKTLTGLE